MLICTTNTINTRKGICATQRRECATITATARPPSDLPHISERLGDRALDTTTRNGVIKRRNRDIPDSGEIYITHQAYLCIENSVLSQMIVSKTSLRKA